MTHVQWILAIYGAVCVGATLVYVIAGLLRMRTSSETCSPSGRDKAPVRCCCLRRAPAAQKSRSSL